jgi:hypothetical protein
MHFNGWTQQHNRRVRVKNQQVKIRTTGITQTEGHGEDSLNK